MIDRSAFFAPGMAPLLEMTIEEESPDEVRATWTASQQLLQPDGILHGGVHCFVVESLASLGGYLWYNRDRDVGTVVGVNNSTDFYRPVRGGRLRSTALPVHRGRTSQVWTVETRDESDRLVARGQLRVQNLVRRPDA